MGKKSRIRRYPQKYGRKYASHPYAKAAARLRQVVEKAEVDGVITEQESLEIKQVKEELAEAVVATTTESAIEEVTQVVEKLEEIVDTVIETAEPVVEEAEEPKKPAAPKAKAPRPRAKTRASSRKKKTVKKET